MSRRAKKQQQTDRGPKSQTDRAPLSGTRISKERGRQRKQQRQRSKSALVVVPSPSAPPASVVAAPGCSAEAAPAVAPASLQLPVANPAPARRPVDEALADVELSFFEGGSLPVPLAHDALAEPPQLVADEVDSVLLTPEQQQRRQWFRRQVMTLMAGMSALGTAAVVVRIASLL